MFRRRATSLSPIIMASLLCLCAGGCSDGLGTRYPVEGQVLVDAKPLEGMAGQVMFVPDAAKGNNTPVSPSGAIDSQGRFKLSAKGSPGAPAGWYKVLVSAVPPGTGDRDIVPRPPLHARFATEKTTPLIVEVVPAPAAGAYDLKTTKK